jgi:hypothetical protein
MQGRAPADGTVAACFRAISAHPASRATILQPTRSRVPAKEDLLACACECLRYGCHDRLGSPSVLPARLARVRSSPNSGIMKATPARFSPGPAADITERIARSLVFHFPNIGLDPLSFATHSCAEPTRLNLPANRQPACFEFQIVIASALDRSNGARVMRPRYHSLWLLVRGCRDGNFLRERRL